MNIYLAGPMRGYPEFNFPAFHAAAKELRSRGHFVFNPAETDHKDSALLLQGKTLPLREYMKTDLRWIMEHAEAVVVLEGWEKSEGASLEVHVAKTLGIPVWPCGDSFLCEKLYYAAGDVLTSAFSTPGETRVKDEKTGGEKGQKAQRFDLLPGDALWEVATVFGEGAKKYAARNWELGYRWSLSFAACQRHLWQFWQQREDKDSETRCYHLASAAFHVLALLAFSLRKIGTDDRPEVKQ